MIVGAVMADRWDDDVRLSDLEPRFVCSACGKHGVDVRPDSRPERTRIVRSCALFPVPTSSFSGVSGDDKADLRLSALHSDHGLRLRAKKDPTEVGSRCSHGECSRRGGEKDRWSPTAGRRNR